MEFNCMNEQQVQDQIKAVKNVLIKQANQMYQLFIDQVNKLPSQQFAKQQALIRFDEGLFWLTQSLQSAPLEVKTTEPQEEATTPAKTIDELPLNPVGETIIAESQEEPDAA